MFDSGSTRGVFGRTSSRAGLGTGCCMGGRLCFGGGGRGGGRCWRRWGLGLRGTGGREERRRGEKGLGLAYETIECKYIA